MSAISEIYIEPISRTVREVFRQSDDFEKICRTIGTERFLTDHFGRDGAVIYSCAAMQESRFKRGFIISGCRRVIHGPAIISAIRPGGESISCPYSIEDIAQNTLMLTYGDDGFLKTDGNPSIIRPLVAHHENMGDF